MLSALWVQAQTPEATISVDESSVTEGDEVTFTVTLSSAVPKGGETVYLGVLDAAGDSSDFLSSSDEGSKKVTVINDDGGTPVVPIPDATSPTEEGEEEVEEVCAVSDVTGDESLKRFVGCAAERIKASDSFGRTLALL